MNEFDFIKMVLSDNFLSHDQSCLKEIDKDGKIVQSLRFDAYYLENRNGCLYRYDRNHGGDHLPFFREGEGTPSGLRSFCDYVYLTENKDYTYIFLIELKRGRTDGYTKQIAASEMFIKYILSSAKRICSENEFPEFDENRVLLRRILVRPPKSKKKPTKVKALPYFRDLNDYITYNEPTFQPNALM